MTSHSPPPDSEAGGLSDPGEDQGEVVTYDLNYDGVLVRIAVKYHDGYVAGPAPTFRWEHPQDGTADYVEVRWEEHEQR